MSIITPNSWLELYAKKLYLYREYKHTYLVLLIQTKYKEVHKTDFIYWFAIWLDVGDITLLFLA